MAKPLTLRVVVTNADTGELLDDMLVPPGNEVVLATPPLYLAFVQEYPTTGTKIITLKTDMSGLGGEGA